MKISYECGPCFLRQAREALDLSTDDEALKMEVIGDIFKYLSDLKNNKNEAEEYAVFDRFSHIEAVMTGITLHVLELNKNNE